MSGRETIAASLALAGGVAAGVGSFLPWVEFSAGPISEQATGVSGWEGKATLIASIVVVVAAARAFAGGSSRLRPTASIGGLVAIGVGTYTAVTAREQLLDAAEGELPRVAVQDALDSGLLELSLAVGIFIVIVGGALCVLGGLLSFDAPQTPRDGSGRGLTGWSTLPPEPATSWSDAPPPAAAPSPWATPPRPDAEPEPPT